MEKNNGFIVVYDEDGTKIEAFYLLSFEIPEYKKKYIVYTMDLDSSKEDIEVLISEIDYEKNVIKSIPENELETVFEMYEELKKQLLEDEKKEEEK